MCGICGVVALDGVLDPVVRDAVPAMTHVSKVGAMFGDHCAGKANHWYPLWAVWMLEWFRVHHRVSR